MCTVIQGGGRVVQKTSRAFWEERRRMSGRVLAPLGHSSLIIVCYQADKVPSLIANTSFKKTKNRGKKMLMGTYSDGDK